VSAIRAALAAGQVDFGENFIQEGVAKVEALGHEGLCWHFIGHLQSNKTRLAATWFDWVQTVDRIRIAHRLNEQRPHRAGPLQVCIQVLVGAEATKSGADPGQAMPLANAIRELPQLRLRGLMAIPPPAEDFDTQRRYFRTLRELYDALRADGHALDTLSIGMSDDLEAAIAEGSTMLRVGTALFGPRPPAPPDGVVPP
jgi:pyridoxal phosphate enzyme (YggS family)